MTDQPTENTSSTTLRFPAEEPAEIKLRVEMSVQQGKVNQVAVKENPVFRFLMKESGRPTPFAMMFDGVKIPGTDMITVTIPPLLGMIREGTTTWEAEGVLEAIIDKRLFVATKLSLEFFREPRVDVEVIREESPVSKKPTEKKKEIPDLSQDIKEILFAVRKEATSPTTKVPVFESPIKTKLKKMILEALSEG